MTVDEWHELLAGGSLAAMRERRDLAFRVLIAAGFSCELADRLLISEVGVRRDVGSYVEAILREVD